MLVFESKKEAEDFQSKHFPPLLVTMRGATMQLAVGDDNLSSGTSSATPEKSSLCLTTAPSSEIPVYAPNYYFHKNYSSNKSSVPSGLAFPSLKQQNPVNQKKRPLFSGPNTLLQMGGGGKNKCFKTNSGATLLSNK